jgi:hypothetical protein
MFLNAYLTKFPLNLNSAYQYVLSDISPKELQLVSAKPITSLTQAEQFIYRSAMLMNIVEGCPINNACLKTHHARVVVDGFPTIPDQMSHQAIYLIRDPRDVCVSLANHLGASIDQTIRFMSTVSQGIELPETKLIHILTTWNNHVSSWMDEDKPFPTRFFRYEDMLANPKDVFIGVLETLKLDKVKDSSERLDFALKETDFQRLQSLEKTTGFLEKGVQNNFFREGTNGQWKKSLNQDQLDQILENHRGVMENYGYS